MIQRRFIKHNNSEIFFSSIRLRHLDERVNLADTGNVLWNKWLNLCVEIDLLGLVPLDVLEEVLYFAAHLQVCELCWVVSSWYRLSVFILIVVVVLLFLGGSLKWLSKLWIIFFWLEVLLLLTNAHINFIFFFL